MTRPPPPWPAGGSPTCWPYILAAVFDTKGENALVSISRELLQEPKDAQRGLLTEREIVLLATHGPSIRQIAHRLHSQRSAIGSRALPRWLPDGTRR